MKCPWEGLVANLAEWARNLIVRRDVHGRYIPPDRRADPKNTAFTEKAEPTDEVLKHHFSGEAVIGLFVLNDEGMCRLGVVDIDRHDDEGSREANERAAIALYDRAIGQGFSAYLEASNGRGGYKLWLIFKEPVPARWVRRYAHWLIRDWEDLGLEREPEIFPKQDELGPGKLGNFVRLPGRHHTIDHWSRIWGDGQWLIGEAAARQILATVGSPGEVIPEEIRSDRLASAVPAPKKSRQGAPGADGLLGLMRSAGAALPVGFPGDYDPWLKVGMSHFDLGEPGLELWEEISRKCPKYRPGACREKWSTFQPGGGLTYKSFLHLARQNGWKPPRPKRGAKAEEPGRQAKRRKPLQAREVASAAEDHTSAPCTSDGRGAKEVGNTSVTGDDGRSPADVIVSGTPGNDEQVADGKESRQGETSAYGSLAPELQGTAPIDWERYFRQNPGGPRSNPPGTPKATEPPNANGAQPAHPGKGDGLPAIIWNNRQMHPVTAEALDALKSFNRDPLHFRLGNVLVRIRNGEGGPSIEHHTENSLRGLLDRSAEWVMSFGSKDAKTKQVLTPPPKHVPFGGKDTNTKQVQTPPPKHIVRDIQSLAEWPPEAFPPLEAIVRCPTYAKDGFLIEKPGYHPGSRTYYSPPPDLLVPPVPARITEEHMDKAKGLLKELIDDFPFKTPGDQATALAVMLTPLARNMISGPTPFFLIEAPVMGTGKTKLAEVLLIPALGRPSTTAQPENDDEWRKSITASLADSPQAIWYDNLAGSLKSQKLEQVLTSEVWTDRWLGETRTVSLPVRCTWLGTANNLQVLGDLHRRIVWIWLVSLMERPEDRDPSQFRHRLPEWAMQNRGDLLWAALVLIRAWVEKGRPPGPQSMASYESWAKTIGGILQVAGFEGFLHAQKERRIDSDDSAIQYEAFLRSIYEKQGSTDFGVNDLKWVVDPEHEEYNDELLQGVLTKETKGERSKQLGWRLKQIEDRVYGRYHLEKAGRDGRSNCRRYKVVKLDAADQTAVKWDQGWDEAVRTSPLFIGRGDAGRSKTYWAQVASRGIRREYLEDYGGQLWEACHALWLSCDGFRLITDKALIRLAESAGTFPRFFHSETEEGRTFDLFNRIDLINYVLRGLMEIDVYDRFEHDGRMVLRYSILLEDEMHEVAEQPCPDGAGRVPSHPEEWYATFQCLHPDTYPMFVDLFRRWWLFENQTLITRRVLSLVHEFNLLPGFADVYPEEPQERELARILIDVQGVEFDGFFIQYENIINNSRTEQGEPDYLFTLHRLRGFVPPPIPADRHSPRERRLWEKDYQITGYDARWLLTPGI